jgi:hypothetical protein
MDMFSCQFDASKLEILIVDINIGDSIDVLNSIFENIAGLRILGLSYQPYLHCKNIILEFILSFFCAQDFSEPKSINISLCQFEIQI